MNEAFNAADTRALRRAAKAAKQAEADRKIVIFNIMSSPAGRSWVYSLFTECGIFATTFTLNALGSAFNEGKRSVGLQILGDVVRFAPDQYIFMMREANDKEQADGGRSNGNGQRGDHAEPGRSDNGRSDDSVGSVADDYDPVDGLDREEPSE